MECREEVASFIDGRTCWVEDKEVRAEEAIEACCSGTPVLASVSRRGLVTPVIRFIARNASATHLLLDAVAVVREWLEKLGALDVAYAVMGSGFAEVRFREECFHPCDEEKAKRIASAVVKSVEAKLRKLCIASRGSLEVLNLVSVEGLRARLAAPRCGAKYFRLENVDKYLWPEEVEHEESWLSTRCVGANVLEKRAEEAKLVDRVGAPPRASVPRTFGRFEVMALLQAARYYLLTGDLEKAKSFGLNRAIFYAWAKYYGPRGRGWVAASRTIAKPTGSQIERAKPVEDEVPVSPRGWFEMDGKEQLPQDFDRQIGLKIEASIPFVVAWRRALAYVRKFPEEVLRDPNKFFKYVYEPVRDQFLEKVVENPVHAEIVKDVEKAWREARSVRRGSARALTRSLEEFFRR